MTKAQLEKRLIAVEHELAAIKAQINSAPPQSNNWVEQIAGTFAHDPLFDKATRLGRKWRASQRPNSSPEKTSLPLANRKSHK